jgi:hypothetical protein
MLLPVQQNSFTYLRAILVLHDRGIILIEMLLPVQRIVLNMYEHYWYSLIAAFWPNLTSVADGRATYPSLHTLPAFKHIIPIDRRTSLDRPT